MQKNNWPGYVFAACGIVYIVGLFIPLMEIDAAQYASISREMLENKSYLQVFDLGRDYLDKPPMLFWLSAFSMKLFGVHGWSYRLPSVLFSILSVYSTYRFALLYYKKEVAVLSAAALASCQAIFLINHDVRTDTMLMGWVIFSIWQLGAWYRSGGWLHFLCAFAGIAGGMMTKGPIALMVPVFALVPHFILKRDWKQLFRWEYIPGLLLIGILLVPMSIGLYRQYDLHPGKIIHGVPIRSGLRFFYWTQSFGRITGESEWKENNSFFFLMQNMLWSFLPWILFFLAALFFQLKKLVTQRFRLHAGQEWIATGGFIVTYCALGSSQAQLPHYIFIVFPLAAVVTGDFLYGLLYTNEFETWKKPFWIVHAVVFSLLWAALILLLWAMFNGFSWWLPPAGLLITAGLVWMMRRRNAMPPTLFACFFTVIGINFFLDAAFYPRLLQYQLGNTAADYIVQSGLPPKGVYIYGLGDNRTLDFYAGHIFRHKQKQELGGTDILVTPSDSIAPLKTRWPRLQVLHTGNDYHVTTLSLPFLNPATRDRELKQYAIVSLGSGEQ